VMQTPELWDLDNPADTDDLARDRALLIEAQMGPRRLVVSEIPSQDSLEVFRITKWCKQSLRMEPIRRST